VEVRVVKRTEVRVLKRVSGAGGEHVVEGGDEEEQDPGGGVVDEGEENPEVLR
jgi:hypothetical protein